MGLERVNVIANVESSILILECLTLTLNSEDSMFIKEATAKRAEMARAISEAIRISFSLLN